MRATHSWRSRDENEYGFYSHSGRPGSLAPGLDRLMYAFSSKSETIITRMPGVAIP